MKKLIFIAFVSVFLCAGLFSFPNIESMNSKVGAVSAEMNSSVQKDPKKNLPLLVNYLVNGAKDASSKTRIIHDWICNNIAYDTEMYFSGRTSKQDYVSVLKKMKGVCSGYSSVFLEMCRLAGVEAIGIKGWSKGFGFWGKLDSSCAHEWNAVKIGENWKLLDCCWDAGYVEGKTFVKHYSTQYYFLPADAFIYSHLPEKDEYQFLHESKRRTQEQFLAEPYAPGLFFRYGFEFTKNSPMFNNEIDGTTAFSLKLTKNDVETSCALKTSQHEDVPDLDWIERKGSVYNYEFDVPDKNDYKGIIFAKHSKDLNYPNKYSIAQFEQQILPMAQGLVAAKPVAGKSVSQKDFDLFKDSFIKVIDNNCYYYKENLFDSARIRAVTNILKILNIPNGYLETVLSFNLKASDLYSGCGFESKYPQPFKDYNSASNTYLLSPKQKILTAGETYHFEFSTSNFTKLAIIVSDEWNFFEKNASTGNFELELEIPEGIENLDLFGTSNGKNYTGLIRWEVK